MRDDIGDDASERQARAHIVVNTQHVSAQALIDLSLRKCRPKWATVRASGHDLIPHVKLWSFWSLYKAETVIRVCADNPFIDPDEIDRLVTFFESNDCDYACNHQNRLDSNYADGFGAEIFSFNLLQKINILAKDFKHREHITLYLWDNKTQFIMMSVPAPEHLRYPDLRFDIDLPEDKDKMELIVNNGATIESSAHEIIELFFSS